MNQKRYIQNLETCTPADSLAYLHHSACQDIKRTIAAIEEVAAQHPEVAKQLEYIASNLDETYCHIEHEVDAHRLAYATHYSTGIAVQVEFYGDAIAGSKIRPKHNVVNHPTVDGAACVADKDRIIPINPREVFRIGTDI